MSSVQGSVSEGTEAAALKIVAVGCAIPCTPTLVHPDYGAWHRSVLNCSFFYIKKISSYRSFSSYFPSTAKPKRNTKFSSISAPA